MNGRDDIRLSFNEAVETYDRVRPGNPSDLFDKLFEMLPARPEIVEVGPGTGKATKDLLARGASVHAIEIGPSMAAKLRANNPSDRLSISVGDFETLSIEPRSADALFSATAYHWIAPRAQTDRPARILRQGGVVAIVDLIQVDSRDDMGFFAAAQPLYQRYGEGHTDHRRPLGVMRIRPSAWRWEPIPDSTTSLCVGMTGTRHTAPRTTGTSCSPIRARR